MIKRIMIPVLITSLLVSLLPGCGSSGVDDSAGEKNIHETEFEEIWESIERKTTACEKVYEYLRDYILNKAEDYYRYYMQHVHASGSQCEAEIEYENIIAVYSLGYGYDLDLEEWKFYYTGGLWYYHEDTGVVEAGNELAEKLLMQIETAEPEYSFTTSDVGNSLSGHLMSSMAKYPGAYAGGLTIMLIRIPAVCEAERDDSGRWTIESVGYRYDEEAGEWKYDEHGGIWYYYEDDGNIEPGNVMAENLLKYLKGAEEDSLGK